MHESPETYELLRGGAELIPHLEELWEILFDHHLEIGAAGLATIDRADTWPLRHAHYERLFAAQPRAEIWVAVEDGKEIAYALAYEDLLDGERVVVLETLSVRPEARSRGLGARLMGEVAAAAGEWGIDREVVDLMGGNERARDMYLRSGFAPYSETWMRSCPSHTQREAAGYPARAIEMARDLGLELELLPGPDDTWRSSERMASLTLGAPSGAGLVELCLALEQEGIWTVFVEIPVALQGWQARELLGAEGFRVSTERLGRALSVRQNP